MTTSNLDEELKSQCWVVTADRQVLLDVYFGETVTYEEAKKRFNRGDWEDIMDEETEYEEFVDADPC